MKKIMYLGLLAIAGNVCLTQSMPPVSSSTFKASITKLLDPYQSPMPAQVVISMESFDHWIIIITATPKPTWEQLARELLKKLNENRNQIVALEMLEKSDYSNYAEYRMSILKSQMASILNQRKQEFLALNKVFNIENKNNLASESEKNVYDAILAAFTPPDRNYIEANKNKLFKEHIQIYILTKLGLYELGGLPETDLPKNIATISGARVLKAILRAIEALTEIQSNIELLNAQGSAGLKTEVKEKIKKESGYFFNPTDPAFKNLQKELNLLRVQHDQLEIIRDYYIFIISKLLERKFSETEQTTLKTLKEQFEVLKKRRAQEVSWFRYFFPEKPNFGV